MTIKVRKTAFLIIRVTPQEKQEILKKAAVEKLNISEYVRAILRAILS